MCKNRKFAQTIIIFRNVKIRQIIHIKAETTREHIDLYAICHLPILISGSDQIFTSRQIATASSLYTCTRNFHTDTWIFSSEFSVLRKISRPVPVRCGTRNRVTVGFEFAWVFASFFRFVLSEFKNWEIKKDRSGLLRERNLEDYRKKLCFRLYSFVVSLSSSSLFFEGFRVFNLDRILVFILLN